MIEYLTLQELGITSQSVTIKSVDEKIGDLRKNRRDRQDEADLYLMYEGLDALKQWCFKKDGADGKKKRAYYAFFENTMAGAFMRYRMSKTATWGLRKNLFKVLCVVLSPIVSGIVVFILEELVKAFKENADVHTIVRFIPVTIALGAAFILIQMYLEWKKNKNDKETWVRHSICYNRLNLALSMFTHSKQTEEDFEILVASTYEILEQNLDQFALNMSSNGMAERPEISAGEEDHDE